MQLAAVNSLPLALVPPVFVPLALVPWPWSPSLGPPSLRSPGLPEPLANLAISFPHPDALLATPEQGFECLGHRGQVSQHGKMTSFGADSA